MEIEKKYENYANKLIIADASPLIELNKLNKMDYLKKLFKEIYTTKTIEDECNFILPKWIKIEEPQEISKNIINIGKIDEGERSAIALAIEKNIIKKEQSCVILDQKGVRDKLKKRNIEIDFIGLLKVFNLAYENNYITKEEVPNLIIQLKKNRFRMPKNAINIIYGDNKIKGKDR